MTVVPGKAIPDRSFEANRMQRKLLVAAAVHDLFTNCDRGADIRAFGTLAASMSRRMEFDRVALDDKFLCGLKRKLFPKAKSCAPFGGSELVGVFAVANK
jgi:hypothetical protein